MKKKIFKVDSTFTQAKYRQIIQSVITAIREGDLKHGDKVPSINEIALELSLSRDTVLIAFNELKARGILKSVAGKGYYVESTRIDTDIRVLLLFDEFNAFKEDLYNSFIENLKGKAEVGIYFHHFNSKVFAGIIRERKAEYTTFVIMPAILKGTKEVIGLLPAERVYLLDQMPDDLRGCYPGVYQSFEEDMYLGLEQGLDRLRNYNQLVLVYPGGKEPIGFLNGFERFCRDFEFKYDVVSSLREEDVQASTVYVLPNDRDLVKLVRKCRIDDISIGKDIGIISLNDTGLKEIVANGITTISTDFYAMGKILADMILENKKEDVKNPSRLILRSSL
jgi:DNA-binding transcriptional regulator YhcF (GntR family)